MAKLTRKELVLVFTITGILLGMCRNVLSQTLELVPQTGHISGVSKMVFSPDGQYLASAGAMGEIKLWEIASGRELREFRAASFSALAFSPSGGRLVTSGFDIEKSEVTSLTSEKYFIRTLDLRSGAQLGELQRGDEPIRGVVFSTDGKTIAAAVDSQIEFWNATSGTKLSKSISTEYWVNSIAYSPDGRRIAATVGDARSKGIKVMIWDSSSLEKIRTFDGFEGSISFSKDNKEILFSGSNELKAYNLETGETTSAKFAGNVVISPDETLFAVAPFKMDLIEASSIEVFSIAAKKKLVELVGFASFLTQRISLEGNMLATSGRGVTKLWGFDRGDPLMVIDRGEITKLVRFSTGGNAVAIVAYKNVEVWDTAAKRRVFNTISPDPISGIAFAHDGSQLAIGDDAGHISVWNVASGVQVKTLNGTGSIQALAFSHDNKKLLSGGTDKQLRQWDLVTGKEITRYEKFDFGSGKQAHIFPIKGVAFSPNDTKVISLDFEAAVGSWDAATGANLEYYLDGPSKPQLAELLAVFPDFREEFGLVRDHQYQFQGGNGAVIIDDYSSEKQIGSIVPLNAADWLVSTPDGFFDGAPNAWKQMIWRFNNNTFDYGAVELYFNDFFYPGLLKDLLAGKGPKPKGGRELEKIDRRQPRVEIVVIDGQANERSISTGKRTTVVAVEVTENNGPKKQPDHASAGGARDLRLFRNGSLVKVWHGDMFDKASGCETIATKPAEPRRVRCTAEVGVVTGANSFTSYAFNSSNVKSNDAAAAIEGKAPKGEGTLYLLEVGVDKYRDTQKDLSYAVADIDAIAQKLTEQQVALKQKQYAETKIISLKNENATKANILLALNRLAKDGEKAAIPTGVSPPGRDELAKIVPLQPEDGLVIYYAGHGTARCVTDEKSQQTNCDRFYLIPHDGFPSSDGAMWKDELYQHSISDEELSTALETVDAGKMLMIIDACNSGAIEGEETRRGPMNSRGLAQLAYEKGMDVLTASQSLQSAQEGLKVKDKQGNVVRMNHGLLTYALLQAFGDSDADPDKNGLLTESEWFAYAVTQVPRLQLDAIKFRNAEIVHAGKKDVPPGQTPRLFTRREADPSPLIVGRQ